MPARKVTIVVLVATAKIMVVQPVNKKDSKKRVKKRLTKRDSIGIKTPITG
jgi:hypothetical protein